MKRATLDILDASIPDDYAAWRSDPDDRRFPAYKRTFLTDPVFWERHRPADWAYTLTWNEFQYSEISTPDYLDLKIPGNDPGVYVFYIRPDQVINRFPQFALYLGISNERGSNRPLRERLKDYAPSRVAARKKRDNIDQMLQMYFGVLWIAYATVLRPSAELVELEQKLHGFIYPCYARRDYPDDILTLQRRFPS